MSGNVPPPPAFWAIPDDVHWHLVCPVVLGHTLHASPTLVTSLRFPTDVLSILSVQLKKSPCPKSFLDSFPTTLQGKPIKLPSLSSGAALACRSKMGASATVRSSTVGCSLDPSPTVTKHNEPRPYVQGPASRQPCDPFWRRGPRCDCSALPPVKQSQL